MRKHLTMSINCMKSNQIKQTLCEIHWIFAKFIEFRNLTLNQNHLLEQTWCAKTIEIQFAKFDCEICQMWTLLKYLWKWLSFDLLYSRFRNFVLNFENELRAKTLSTKVFRKFQTLYTSQQRHILVFATSIIVLSYVNYNQRVELNQLHALFVVYFAICQIVEFWEFLILC